MATLPPSGEPVLYAAGPAGREGPMTAEELAARVRDGRLPADAHVWWPGLEDWVPLASQPALAAPEPEDAGAPEPPQPEDGAAPEPPEPEDGAAPEPAEHAPPAPVSRLEASPEELARTFAGLVEASWRHHRLLEDTERADEVLVGGLIVAALDTGRVLIDLESDAATHFLRFEDPWDRSHLAISVSHLTRDATTARAIGQRAALTVAYGEAVTRLGRVVDAMRMQAKSGYVDSTDPGVVTFHRDDESKYLYAQVDLYLEIDDYVSDELEVDYDGLTVAVGACVHALRRFLAGSGDDDEGEET